jgi:hypothetical protein
MVVPEAAVDPVTSDSATVQLKVVPVTVLVNAMEGAVPEHIVWDAGVDVATGIGFTVTTTGIGVPVQALAVGVIV